MLCDGRALFLELKAPKGRLRPDQEALLQSYGASYFDEVLSFWERRELDPGQPRGSGTSLKTRVRHYLNLRRTAPRL